MGAVFSDAYYFARYNRLTNSYIDRSYVFYSSPPQQKDEQKLKVLLLQYEDRPEEKYRCQNLFKDNEAYAKQHGYDYKFHDVNDMEIPPYWIKVFLIDKYMQSYDYIMWIDSDAVVYEFKRRVEDFFFNQTPLLAFVGCEDTPPGISPFMAAVFITKCKHSISEQMYTDWKAGYNYSHWKRSNDGRKWVASGVWSGSAYEQGYFNFHILPKYKDHIKLLPYFWFHMADSKACPAFAYHFHGSAKDSIEQYCRR